MLCCALACASTAACRRERDVVVPPASLHWQLRCDGVEHRDVRLPVRIPRGCVLRSELPVPDAPTGIVAQLDVDRVPELVALVRERGDGLWLPQPPFVASPHAGGLRLSTGPIASGYATKMRLVIGNGDGEPTTVRAASVSELAEVPPHPVGSIVRLEHHTDLDIAAGSTVAELWLPVPLAFGGQVPLELHAALEPADAGELELVRDGEVNLGLVARFAARDVPGRVSVSWTAVVLVRDVLPDERATIAELADSPLDWLSSTTLIDADAELARSIAQTIAAGHGESQSRVARLREWLAKLEFPAELAESNQSTDVLATGGRANCTGSANMAAALGRALGIPSRHLAGVVTDDQLQTHSIVEQRLGTPAVWRRIEPQDGSVVADDYMIVLRVVTPVDEGEAAMDPQRIGAPGVPMRALVEVLKGADRIEHRLETEWFPGCARCDNAATRRATLHDVSLVEMRRLHERARKLWECRVDAAIRERSVVREDRAPDVAAAITTLGELQRWLGDPSNCESPAIRGRALRR